MNPFEETIFIEAVKDLILAGDYKSVKRQLKDNDSTQDALNQLAYHCLIYKDLNMLDLFFQQPFFDPNHHNGSLLKHLSEIQDWETIMHVLNYKNLDPSSHNDYLLKSAATFQQTKIMKKLTKDDRVDFLTNNSFVLDLVLDNEDYEMLRILLESNRIPEQNYFFKLSGNTKMIFLVKSYFAGENFDAFDELDFFN